MIDVITYDTGLPISVIIPHTPKIKVRDDFFNNHVLPMIEANNPIEIIINSNDGSAPKKRNDGFKKATQPFILFSDNDIVFPKNYMENLYTTLVKNPNISYAYTGYYGIVVEKNNHPIRENFRIPTIPFNEHKLRSANYISTMSLIRKEHFPMFDESLRRFQDWDIWLTMLKNGYKGISVPELEFFAYYLDEGITSNTNNEQEAILAIIRKHNLGL
jgi:hypothetical protein